MPDPVPAEPPHLSPADFRALLHRAADFAADYYDRLASGDPALPVLSAAKPGDVLRALPEHPPERPADPASEWDALFRDLNEIILPNLTHWQHPGFFAYFPCNASGPAIVGSLLSAALNVNGMLWATSPAATELEARVLDWMAELLGLPRRFRSASGEGGGCIQGTASESALVAMIAARQRARERHRREPDARTTDPATPDAPVDHRLVAYASTQAHSSITKAAMILGLAASPTDRRRLRLLPTGPDHAMDPAALERAVREDLAAGLVPFFVAATVGTTGSTAVDPLPAIAEVVRRLAPGCWIHIDAAFAGAACVCPEHRWMLDGIEHADSLCMNPHKWLLTNFDCDLFWTADRRSLTAALSITPEYLRNAASEAGGVIDYRDWQIPLGRSFRSLKLWLVLRHYGAEGLRAHIRHHVRLAERFESWVRADGRFEITAPRTTSLVCFRLRPLPGEAPAETDARNRRLMEAVNATGHTYLTHAALPDPAHPAGASVTLRLAIGGALTREEHVRRAWEALRALA